MKIFCVLIFFTVSLCNSQMAQEIISGKKAETFYTSNGKLYDYNGNELIMRGVNNPHFWFYRKSLKALDNIAQTNSNTVRIVWMTKGKPNALRSILEKAVKNNLVVIPELHDFTGNNEISAIEKAANYWAKPEIKAVLDEYKPYVMINIANEWVGKWDTTLWFEGYKKAISILRKAGYKHCIVIDGAGWGQSLVPIKAHAKELIELDPEHNLLFDVHMYGSWNDNSKIINELQYIVDNKIPLIVGEFGYHFNEGNNNLNCKVDAPLLLETCQKLGLGYLAWSWTGNNKENQWLDLVRKWKEPTKWGELVINSENGIKKTSKKCSIFNK